MFNLGAAVWGGCVVDVLSPSGFDLGGQNDFETSITRTDTGEICTSFCEDKSCGEDDGCGNPCLTGSCLNGQQCVDGQCLCTVSSCPDGCCKDDTCFLGTADDHCGIGGTGCSDCLSSDQACDADHQCIDCTPQCAGNVCGAPNGCGGICAAGSCAAGQVCIGGQGTCSAASGPEGCCGACGTGGASCYTCVDDPSTCGARRSCNGTASCAVIYPVTGIDCGVCRTCNGSGACVTNSTDHQDCATSEQCISGVCTACDDRWRVSTPGIILGVAPDIDRSIYVAGNSGNQVYVAIVDSCGTIANSTTFLPAGALSAGLGSLALRGQTVYVGGNAVLATDPREGLLALFSKGTLAPLGHTILHGSTGEDNVWDVVEAGGALWMNGTIDAGSTNDRVWGFKGELAGTTTCGFDLLPGLGASGGRNLIAPAGSGYVYFTGGSADGTSFVARVSSTACAVTPCSSCPAPWSFSFQDGSNDLLTHDIVLVGGNLYVSGFSMPGTADFGGVVLHIDMNTGAVLNSFAWDPTTNPDGLLGLVTDGTALYAVGAKNYNPGAGLPGTPAIIKLTIPSLTEQWVSFPAGDRGLYWDVATTGTDGLVVVGGDDTGGVVRRCLRSGVCP